MNVAQARETTWRALMRVSVLSGQEPKDLALRLSAKLPVWKRVHALADGHYDEVHAHMMRAFRAGRTEVTRDGLRRLLARGHQAVETEMDQAVKVMEKKLSDGLRDLLLQILASGGEFASRQLTKQLRTTLRASAKRTPIQPAFDIEDEDAIAWAEEHATELIDDLIATTRDDLRGAITDALEGDVTVENAISLIFDALGDDVRARTIARTETMTAVSEGQRQAWSQALEKGFLTGQERRVWIITPIEACPECEELDGAEADMDGQYPGEGGDGPPLHPNCRCTEGIIGVGGDVEEAENAE